MRSFYGFIGAVACRAVSAQTSIFVPGFDPQPISADVIGVDTQGRTTWALHKGAITAGEDDAGFVGTATLVEGPNDASLTLVDPRGQFTLGYQCTIAGDKATCIMDMGTTTVTEVETRIAVQLGTTATANMNQVTPAPNPPSNSNTGSSSNSASPPANTKPSGAGRLAPMNLLWLTFVMLGSITFVGL